jgi:hypothetical protein
MNEPPAELYQRLRRETAQLLNFDLSNLSAAQSTRLDRATLLRWELDRIAGSQVRGDAIDVNRAVAASEALERMLSPTASFNGEVVESHTARARLAALINSLAEVTEEDERDEIARLNQVIAEKDSVIAALGGSLAPSAASPVDAAAPQAVSRGHLGHAPTCRRSCGPK